MVFTYFVSLYLGLTRSGARFNDSERRSEGFVVNKTPNMKVMGNLVCLVFRSPFMVSGAWHLPSLSVGLPLPIKRFNNHCKWYSRSDCLQKRLDFSLWSLGIDKVIAHRKRGF